MKRKDFVRQSLLKLGGIIAVPVAFNSCKEAKSQSQNFNDPCALTPRETAGPFSTKSPADLVRANIISDRRGIPLMINLKVLNRQDSCQPLANVIVDVWHCDSHGYYSEYGGMRMQREDFSGEHFLRGRQKTNNMGEVSFISIYPGWYRGRAPHIHLEVFNEEERSLCVSQIAFPEEISNEVYINDNYKGKSDTTNANDSVFRNSLEENMGTVTGNKEEGITLTYDVVVNNLL